MAGALLIGLQSRVKGVVHRQKVLTLLSDPGQVHCHIDRANHVLQAYGHQTSRTASEKTSQDQYHLLAKTIPTFSTKQVCPCTGPSENKARDCCENGQGPIRHEGKFLVMSAIQESVPLLQ
jgi:hypothetical protein